MASPTGSTGYSFSAGGPILDPSSRNLSSPPIAGYLSAIRSVVVSPRQTVRCPGRRRLRVARERRWPRGHRPRTSAMWSRSRRNERPIRLVEPDERAARSGTCSATRSSCSRADGRPRDACSSWRSRDLALIEQLGSHLRRRPQRDHRRDRRRQEPPDRRARPGPRRPGGQQPGPPWRRGRPGAGPVRAARRPLICVREVSLAGRSTARVDDEPVTASRAWPRSPGRSSRSTASTISSACSTSASSATCSTPSAASRRKVRTVRAAVERPGGRTRPRCASSRSSRASWPAGSSCPSTRRPRSSAARLRVGEADEIRARLAAAQHGEAIERGARQAIHDELVGGVGAASVRASARTRVTPRPSSPASTAGSRPLAERLAGLSAEAEDIAAEARNLAEQLDHDPSAARAPWRSGCRLIYALERRYGDDERAVDRARPDDAADEASRLRDLDGERDAPAGRGSAPPGRGGRGPRPTCRRPAATAAERLSAAVVGRARWRSASRDAASRSRSADERQAPDEPAVELDGDAVAFDATGIDDVVFLIAPNPGEPARPLARIASGGELSRVALADQGGPRGRGRDADARLRRDRHGDRRPQRRSGRAQTSGCSGARHQVLCVTHLPQIAAHADAHFRISKRERRGPDGDRGRTPRSRRPAGGARPDARRRAAGASADGGRGLPAGAAQLLGGARGAARRPRPAGAGRDGSGRPCLHPEPGAGSSPHRERGIRPRRRPDLVRDRGVPALPPGRARALAAATLPRLRRRPGATSRPARGVGRGWDHSAEPASRYLGRSAAGRRAAGRPPPLDQPRRRAASIRGFYRFALGDELHRVDLAGTARPAAPAATAAGPARGDRGGAACSRPAGPRGRVTRRAGAPARSATAPCSSCCTPPASGSARRLGLDADDLSTRGRLRPGDRQGRQGAARAGRRRRRWTGWPVPRRSVRPACARRSHAEARPSRRRARSS